MTDNITLKWPAQGRNGFGGETVHTKCTHLTVPELQRLFFQDILG